MITLFKVLEYQTESWKKPYAEWLRGLKDRIGASIIKSRVARMKLGHFGTSRHVGNGVCELKVRYGPGYRVYYLRDGEQLIILLCGGDKGDQDRDVERAKDYATDYWRRK
jgi:putative addiction module killer protein